MINGGTAAEDSKVALSNRTKVFGWSSRVVILLAAVGGLYAAIFSSWGVMAQYHMYVIRKSGGKVSYSPKLEGYWVRLTSTNEMSNMLDTLSPSIDFLSSKGYVYLDLHDTSLSDDDFRYLLSFTGPVDIDIKGTNVSDKALYATMYSRNTRVSHIEDVSVSEEALAEYGRVKSLLRD